LAQTTLGIKAPGARVNLEVDVIAKYTERLLARPGELPRPDTGGRR
ncbi:MAG: riboflavin synthase, partial [Actinocrinis sp.]